MIDGHNDLPWAMRCLGDLELSHHDLAHGVPEVRTDLLRLRAGGVTGQFWSVYVPSNLTGPEAVSATLEQIDFVHRMIGLHSDDLAFATTAREVEAAWDGRIASLIGMEGGHAIDSSLGGLRMLFALALARRGAPQVDGAAPAARGRRAVLALDGEKGILLCQAAT